MQVSLTQLTKVMRGSPKSSAYIGFLNAAMVEFGIQSERRIEMFLAQLGHETGALATMQENLNYSAEGLCKTWPTRFTSLAMAQSYARNPQKIANKVYANRMGNGDEKSGDGWRARGAGMFQLTGLTNQNACADYFGIDHADIGDWLRTPEGACRSAAWFWSINKCNQYADANDFDAVSDAINLGHQTSKEGDAIGYADRLAFLRVAEVEIV